MNEQQMEAVEKLVEDGIFPKGVIAVTEMPYDSRVRAYVFLPSSTGNRRTVLHSVFDMLREGGDDGEGEEWKCAKIS